MLTVVLLGQSASLHSFVSVDGPRELQSFPFPSGIGLVHPLSLTATPTPHVKEHPVNSDHSEYPPFTGPGGKKEKSLCKNKHYHVN